MLHLGKSRAMYNVKRQFRAKKSTRITLKDGDSSKLQPSEILEIKEGTVIETNELINKSVDSGKLIISFSGYFFGEDWEEIKKNFDLEKMLPKNRMVAFFGSSLTDSQYHDLMSTLVLFKINDFNRITHFLAQIHHESGGLKWLRELADGTAYEGRKDLGNIHPGDGPKYKGAGVIQLTGRKNYAAFAEYMNDNSILEIGCQYVANTYPFSSAGYWWEMNKMNSLCDNKPTVEQVTRRVNGGTNGLDDRRKQYARIVNLLSNG